MLFFKAFSGLLCLDVARMIKGFENVIPSSKVPGHHEQTPSTQTAFKKDVLSVVSEFRELGNPYDEQGDEPIAVHTRDVMDSAVVDTVQNVLQIGKSQYDSYVQESLIDRSKRITDPIKKNNQPLLNTLGKKCQSKEKAQVASLKEDCALFSRLYIACHRRDGNDLDEFFKYENKPWPPALSQMNQLRGGQKADLVKCLEIINVSDVKQPPVDAVIRDGAVAGTRSSAHI